MKNFTLKFVLTVVLGWCFAFAAEAQTVRGVVKDAAGEPVIGAAVIVEGTTLGASTGVDGSFTLNVPDAKNNVLVVSYIGMTEKRVAVAGKTSVEVVLEEDATGIEDVVVIGYGTVKRRDLTGSVASVTGEKLAANPVSNIAEALQGQLPGVQVTSQDGRPGGSVSIRVRGGGSITQSNEPLFIVDGIQVSDISDIPADNIESMDVLKDAASTAIYGARGANGVILITTKGGQKDQRLKVNYNMYYQLRTLADVQDGMNAYDMVYSTWSYATAYGETYADNVATYYGLGSKYGNHLNEYKNMAVHNYADDIMQTATAWNHDLSLSGGNDKTQYYAAVNYTDGEGVRVKSGYRRWGANVKLVQKLAKTLTFNADLRYSDVRNDGAQYGTASTAFRFRPIDNPLGSGIAADLGMGSSNVEDVNNPVNIVDNYTTYRFHQRIRAASGLTWQPFKGMTAKTELSLSRNWSETQDWDAGLQNGYSTAKLSKSSGYGVRWATTLNYEVQGLGDDHSLTILAGNEVLSSKSNSSSITGAGYPSEFTMEDAFGMINMTDSSLGKDGFSSTIGTPNHTLSWFGRVNYSYKGKYLLTATFRADGSSKFAPNNQWGYFPAAAAAWRISDESFMENTRDWLDNLKLRVSYGTSGSDNISASLWQSTWNSGTVTIDGVVTPVYNPGSMKANPDLMWETTTSRNVGVDFSFWNGRLRGAIDAYWNSTDDILMKMPIDASSGYSYQFQNAAKTSNKGVEVGLSADLVRKKDFNLSLNVSYSYNKSNIDELDENALADTNTGWGSSMRMPLYDYIIRVGQPIGLIQGYVSDGYYTIDDFEVGADGSYTLKQGVPDNTAASTYPQSLRDNFKTPQGQNAFPGMVKFKDVNGDETVTSDDVAVIGETLPKHTGGFTLSGNWKNIDFAAAFTYQIGGKVYNATAMHAMMANKDTSFGQNRLAFIGDTFKYYAPDASGDLHFVSDPAELAELNKTTKYASFMNEYGLTTSNFVEDASYLRLQNLTIGYSLPSKWLKKIKIEKVRVYFTGSNLFCLSGYSGLDPDVNTDTDGSNGFPTPNYDFNAYPKARTYTFGLNVTF